jgi:hypothetical protein
MTPNVADVTTSAQLTATVPPGAESAHAAIINGTRTTLIFTMIACLPTAVSRSPSGKAVAEVANEDDAQLLARARRAPGARRLSRRPSTAGVRDNADRSAPWSSHATHRPRPGR